MSPTARVALTVVCYTLALVAGIAGIALLLAEGRRTARALRRWRDEEPGEEGLFARQRQLDGIVDVLLGNAFDRTAAAVLLVVGVVAGVAGNVLSLWA
jgi:hypothetical protein